MASNEATQHMSLLQLGIHTAMIKTALTQSDLNGLFLFIQPAHLQKMKGKALGATERDEARAELIREKLKDVML